MAVFIEALNVVVQISRIKTKFLGGLKAFKENIPNRTLCMDSWLARVGFMSTIDVQNYVDYLERSGLTFISDEKAQDIVVIDQFNGPTTQCDWIQLVKLRFQGKEFQACKSKNEPNSATHLYLPDGWEASSGKLFFVEKEKLKKRLLYLGRDGGVEHYLDMNTGKDVYVGRTTGQEGVI